MGYLFSDHLLVLSELFWSLLGESFTYALRVNLYEYFYVVLTDLVNIPFIHDGWILTYLLFSFLAEGI